MYNSHIAFIKFMSMYCIPTHVQHMLNSPTSKQEARDSGDQDFGDTGSREVTVTEQVIVLETGSNQNKERQCIPEKVNNCSCISVHSMSIYHFDCGYIYSIFLLTIMRCVQ